jgi:hypothetical protein
MLKVVRAGNMFQPRFEAIFRPFDVEQLIKITRYKIKQVFPKQSLRKTAYYRVWCLLLGADTIPSRLEPLLKLYTCL